jgi:hypothetical protein
MFVFSKEFEMKLRNGFMLMMLAIGVQLGCADTPAPVNKAASKVGTEKTTHAAWWCEEHGIPEAECSMCSPKVAKECKVNGDWCEKHDRAKSQCFVCDPSLQAKFAAKYEAKYGKAPPALTEELPAAKP